MDRETQLMLAVRDGSAEAFRELYALYEKPLAGFLHRLCWNRALVEDLLQEVMLRVWRAASGYEPRARVSTWIFRIAHNLWINESAKRRAEAPSSDIASRTRPVGSGRPRTSTGTWPSPCRRGTPSRSRSSVRSRQTCSARSPNPIAAKSASSAER